MPRGQALDAGDRDLDGERDQRDEDRAGTLSSPSAPPVCLTARRPLLSPPRTPCGGRRRSRSPPAPGTASAQERAARRTTSPASTSRVSAWTIEPPGECRGRPPAPRDAAARAPRASRRSRPGARRSSMRTPDLAATYASIQLTGRYKDALGGEYDADDELAASQDGYRPQVARSRGGKSRTSRSDTRRRLRTNLKRSSRRTSTRSLTASISRPKSAVERDDGAPESRGRQPCDAIV
jgi:hypothetical protein